MSVQFRFFRFIFLRPTIVCFCLALWCAAPSHAMQVVVDAGHGGADTGASHHNKTESAITLNIAKFLQDQLKADKSFQVTMTRSSDKYVALESRYELANEKGALLISIHVNSSPDPKVRGSEIYFQNLLDADEDAYYLASRENQNLTLGTKNDRQLFKKIKTSTQLNADVAAIIDDLNRNNRIRLSGIFAEHIYHNWAGDKKNGHNTIKQAPFRVISNANMPAVLVEVGYLSHPDEAELLNNPDYQKKIAQGLYRAINSFRDFLNQSPEKSLN